MWRTYQRFYSVLYSFRHTSIVYEYILLYKSEYLSKIFRIYLILKALYVIEDLEEDIYNFNLSVCLCVANPQSDFRKILWMNRINNLKSY